MFSFDGAPQDEQWRNCELLFLTVTPSGLLKGNNLKVIRTDLTIQLFFYQRHSIYSVMHCINAPFVSQMPKQAQQNKNNLLG